jgi:hypothetical protein
LFLDFPPFQFFENNVTGPFPYARGGNIDIYHIFVSHGAFNTDLLLLWDDRSIDGADGITWIALIDVSWLVGISPRIWGHRRGIVRRSRERNYGRNLTVLKRRGILTILYW